MNPLTDRCATPKPVRGSSLVAARMRRSERVSVEQAVMRQAVRLDGDKCRFPGCRHRSRKLPIDPCHARHRGMGGNPKGDRTTLETVIALCRFDHGRYDAGQLDIEPMDESRGFRGRCVWYERNEETGQMVHVATDPEVRL